MTLQKKPIHSFTRHLEQGEVAVAGRLPALPLITCDPYFSLWSGSDCLHQAETMHWTGRQKRVTGKAVIDGVAYRFMGLGEEPAMKQTALAVSATCTEYSFEAAGVALKVDFWTPLLLDDLDVMSRPCSYVDMEVVQLDDTAHEVKLLWEFSGDLCCNEGQLEEIGGGSFEADAEQLAWMGLRRQHPLGHSGDSITIDWGYLYLAVEDTLCKEVSFDGTRHSLKAEYRFALEGKESQGASLVAAYDDLASINYYGRMLPGYWARNGKTIVTAIHEALTQRAELLDRCIAFEKQLTEKTQAFGPAYSSVCIAAYRQAIAAHKLVADENGKALFISKECHSNGCAATVDVTYPSTPLFFLFNPELVRAMMRPVLAFAKMPVWHYDFAPHDAGRFPYVTGQVYGLKHQQRAAENIREDQGFVFPMLYQMPASAQMYHFEGQMPVEESGNMLILAAWLVRQEPEKAAVDLEENLPLYEKWVKYLVEYGADPGEQLCTDDFAGHLAHNVNLAMKAIMGIESYAILVKAAGRVEEAQAYHEKAAAMAQDVYERALAKDHTKLTFDGSDESWSLKYNAVWDLIFGSGLWKEEFYRAEIAQYRRQCNAFGVPLDPRATYTKSDWEMWAAALDPDGAAVEEFAQRILTFLEKSPDRAPFSDWYMTQDGKQRGFQNRTVQGGIFMPLLVKQNLTD